MRTSFTYFIFITVCLIASAHARAQPLFPHANSIEATVANADLVVIAKVEKFGVTSKADGNEVPDATINVEETLKLDLSITEPYTRVSIRIPASAAALADWTKRSARLLIAHDSDVPHATVVIELKDKMEVMKADMTLLRDPDEVIKAAKEALKTMPAGVKRIHTFQLQVPRELIRKTEWEPFYNTGGHLRLSVPVDKHLEKRALDSLRSEILTARAEGARALRYFKTEENIARVKALLNDPGHVEGHGTEVIYVVRYAAYETMRAWRMDVEKPVFRENVPK